MVLLAVDKSNIWHFYHDITSISPFLRLKQTEDIPTVNVYVINKIKT